MSDIERVRGLRRRLEQGHGLTVAEVGLLLDEVERVHASREACVFTINGLHAELERLRPSLVGGARD